MKGTLMTLFFQAECLVAPGRQKAVAAPFSGNPPVPEVHCGCKAPWHFLQKT